MVNRCCNTTQHVTNITQNDFESNLSVKPSDTGCKENHFYSLPFGQAKASIY